MKPISKILLFFSVILLPTHCTQSKDKQTLYAIILGWPENKENLTISSLSSGKASGKAIEKVELPGVSGVSDMQLVY